MAKSTKKRPAGSSTPLLTKWQRNAIFESIQAAGLDPREFAVKYGQVKARLKHKSSASWFNIERKGSYYTGRYVVGDGLDWPFDAYSWGTVVARIRGWLEEVKRDVATLDLWAELQRETELFRVYSDHIVENTPFSSDERSEIASRLQELSDRVRRAGALSMEQMEVLNSKIDYLTQASGRLGRIDWRNAFAGVILTYLLALALSPESARDIVVQLFRAIGHFYGLPELPGK